MHSIPLYLDTSAALKFLENPKDVRSKLGHEVVFSVKTAPIGRAYTWYFEEKPISLQAVTYKGCITNTLTISKFLPKHKGAYKCKVTNEQGRTFSSSSATLSTGKITRVAIKRFMGQLRISEELMLLTV